MSRDFLVCLFCKFVIPILLLPLRVNINDKPICKYTREVVERARSEDVSLNKRQSIQWTVCKQTVVEFIVWEENLLCCLYEV